MHRAHRICCCCRKQVAVHAAAAAASKDKEKEKEKDRERAAAAAAKAQLAAHGQIRWSWLEGIIELHVPREQLNRQSGHEYARLRHHHISAIICATGWKRTRRSWGQPQLSVLAALQRRAAEAVAAPPGQPLPLWLCQQAMRARVLHQRPVQRQAWSRQQPMPPEHLQGTLQTSPPC